jgi:3-dehydroquinate synthase
VDGSGASVGRAGWSQPVVAGLDEVTENSGATIETMSPSESLRTVDVRMPAAPYPIFIGSGLLGRLPQLVTPPPFSTKCVVLTSQNIHDLYGEQVVNGLSAMGLEVKVLQVPRGEEAKSTATLEECWRQFGLMFLGRRDLLVALGGGVVGDLGGFAAATWNRGIPVLQIATTIVAQVDSAIGGKTAVNLPEGKNLVGAFHQPIAVICDSGTLTTLPERELRAGLAEIVKYGFIADPVILDLLTGKSLQEITRDESLLVELLSRSASVKAGVVAQDELETGGREVLNYGHTFGHALETLSQYHGYLHGEAISVGMVFSARLGEQLGISETGFAEKTVRLLSGLGLPTCAPEKFSVEEVWTIMRRDKKARGGVRFVLCPQAGEAILVDPPDQDVVKALMEDFAREASDGLLK